MADTDDTPRNKGDRPDDKIVSGFPSSTASRFQCSTMSGNSFPVGVQT